MKLLIDVTTWVPGRSGVGLYTERLLEALVALGYNDELFLASNINTDEVTVQGMPVGPKMPLRAFWMQSALPITCVWQQPDVAFFPNYMMPVVRTCPTVVTVHDMAIFLHPQTFTWKKRILQRALLPSLLKRADAILTPSHSTKRDLLKLIDLDPRRIVPIHLAADPRLSKPLSDIEVAEARAELNLPDRYLLAVSTLEPRKNLVRLIAAFEKISQKHRDVHLLLVGGKGWRDTGIRTAMSKSSAADRIIATGYITFNALRLVYRDALALCYPSLYEGFGLPIVEAMACGAPVLTSCGSSIDEVAENAALMVDPYDTVQIADGMSRLIKDETLRIELRRKGLHRASKLSWMQTAELTRDVFSQVAQGRLPRMENKV